MKEISKFISMDGTEGTPEEVTGSEIKAEESSSAFKVCDSNLPVKASFWTRLKGVLTYQVKVELTPYEQKVEDEINEFLHQDVTWQSFKDFLFQDITITY